MRPKRSTVAAAMRVTSSGRLTSPAIAKASRPMPPHARRRLFGTPDVDVDDRDVGTVLGECLAEHPAQPAAAARDQRLPSPPR